MRAFLCYANQDAELALTLAYGLQLSGISVSMDTAKLSRDDGREAEFQQQLARVDAFLFLLSNKVEDDAQFNAECLSILRAEWTGDDRVTMLPVVIDDGQIPVFLDDLRPIRITNPVQDRNQLIDEIICLLEGPHKILNPERRRN